MLHIGGGDMIPLKHVVAILDMEAAQSPDMDAFLQGHDLPPGTRTAIVTHAWGKTVVRPSAISSLTLMIRAQDAIGHK